MGLVDLVDLLCVPKEIFLTHRQSLVASVLIYHRVPNGMEVEDGSARVCWNFLSIPTLVTSWEAVIDLSYTVEGLVDIADIMNHESESDGALVFCGREVLRDLTYVFRRRGILFSLQESGQISHCMNDIDVRDNKIWEVLNRSAELVQVRLVHVVPRGLPGSPGSLYIVSEGSALSESVISFVNNHTRVSLLKDRQFDERSLKHSACLLS